MNIEVVHQMKHSPVNNYVVPGLTSWLIGAPNKNGTVRFFECSRDHQENITPHSHRFDFRCLVLQGHVTNRIWTKGHGDYFIQSTLNYDGHIGQYTKIPDDLPTLWNYEDRHFTTGQTYGMKADEVHSIYFSRGTEVLFFEGPTISSQSVIIEPFVHDERIPTMKVEEWMFRKP